MTMKPFLLAIAGILLPQGVTVDSICLSISMIAGLVRAKL